MQKIRVEDFTGSSSAALAVVQVSSDEVIKSSSPTKSQDERFEVGSLTKVFTGTLLGILAESGDIDPHTPVDRLLQEPLPWSGRSPTLIELATHRSGLPNTPTKLLWREWAIILGFTTKDPWRHIDQAGYDMLLKTAAKRARISEKPLYSSMGVGLLGEALSSAMGISLADLLKQRVLDPLNMTQTGFDKSDSGLDRVERPVNWRGKPLPYLVDHMPAAGMLASTTEDLAKLIRASWGDGPKDVVAGLRRAQEPIVGFGGSIKVGYCWLVTENERGERTAFHNGSTWGSQALLEVNVDTLYGFAVLSACYRNIAAISEAIKNQSHETR